MKATKTRVLKGLRSGSSGSSFVLGRRGFAKISAVEGLRMTAAMEADFREFDRKGLSHSERRALIARKYGRVNLTREPVTKRSATLTATKIQTFSKTFRD